MELRQMLIHWKKRLKQFTQSILAHYRERLRTHLLSHAMRRPESQLREYRLRLDELHRLMESTLQHQLHSTRNQLEQSSGKLRALNPMEVLRRGYSITTRALDKQVLTRATDLSIQEKFHVRLFEGSLDGIVERIHKSREE
jgi:exodeoxyribonuclease VII large subunit